MYMLYYIRNLKSRKYKMSELEGILGIIYSSPGFAELLRVQKVIMWIQELFLIFEKAEWKS